MTTELVTAHAGTNHVGSEDAGAMQAGAFGAGRYAVELGDNLAVTMDDANTVRIGTGGFFLDGRFVRVSEAETVKVANGGQGAYRKDLVTYTYERDPSNGNVETGVWGVLQGTAAPKESDAKAPDYEAGNVLDGDLKATVAVAEVDLDGLTPTARLLLPSVASLKSLGESVSPVESTVFSGLPVEGFARGGCVTIYVHGSGVLTRRGTRIRVATLRPGCRPGAPVRTLFGSSGSSWGLIEVDTDGSVYTNHLYGEDSVTWATVSVSLTFAR